MSRHHLIITLSVVLGALVACSTTQNKPVPTLPTAVPVSVRSSNRFHWTVGATATEQTGAFYIQDSSAVSISTDSAQKEVPFVSRTFYEVTLIPGDSATIHLHIDSTSVEHDGMEQLQLPLDVRAKISSRGKIADLQTTETSSCKDGLDPKVVRLFDLIIPAPQVLVSIGDQWADTSDIILCHGKTALKQASIRQYTLLQSLSFQKRNALQIQRVLTSTIDGMSADSTNHLTAHGIGSGTAIIIIDQQTGLLLESSSTSDLTLSIVTSRGTFPFHQHAVTQIQPRQP